MDKRILIIISILILVGLGLFFFSAMTGNVVTGSVILGKDRMLEKNVTNEYYRISDFGDKLMKTNIKK